MSSVNKTLKVCLAAVWDDRKAIEFVPTRFIEDMKVSLAEIFLSYYSNR